MDLDDIVNDEQFQPIIETPKVITDTINKGEELLDVDYLDKIKTIKELKPYVKDLKEMNLKKRGWGFQFGSSREWVGLCSADPNTYGKSKGKNIYVSIEFVKHWKGWEGEMKNTILHEIAHAIMFEIFWFDKRHIGALSKIDELHKISQGHGILWGLVCAKIKGSKERCSITIDTPGKSEQFKPYFYECPNCNNVEYGYSPHFSFNCSNCGFETRIERNPE